ncbi:MAG: PTS system, glucose-specific IIA component [uncultured Sulfurovum sp.]|uniref:PTS system glucose-specific EIIA component n=1 Tax=uncultured Sulfurovum sp. TaxID=269237 RepID=A0A6S6SP47_9BACT|nr:MAG: PTS system, glucose-specific IIA component [uncultured Sulfurovum sp.]
MVKRTTIGTKMFGLFKAKKQVLVSPADGDIIKLIEVPDEVFSQKMAGDGIAILPRTNTFVAPVAGTITKIFSTNHAFSIQTKSGLEVLVHIGLDTVALNGEGFKRLVKEGDTVSVGKPIISADLEFIQSKGIEIITPVVVNHERELLVICDKVKTIREGDELLEVTVQ